MALCELGNIESVLSAEGVMLRTDDVFPYDTTTIAFVNDCIEEATNDIHMYVWERYATADLEGTVWGKWKCAVISACLLCARRGNSPPKALQARCDRIYEELEAIRDGHLSIPNLAESKRQIPSMSNVMVSNLYRVGRVRVVGPTSLGRKESTVARHADHSTIFGFVQVW